MNTFPLPYPDFSEPEVGEPYATHAQLWVCEVTCAQVRLSVMGTTQVEAVTRAVALQRLLAGGLWLVNMHELGAGVVGVDLDADGNTVVSYPAQKDPPHDRR